MTQETAEELVRYYLMGHGVECGEIKEHFFNTHFDFIYKGYKLCLSIIPRLGIDIRAGRFWFSINLKHDKIDETNPAFDPEVFFRPLLIAIKKHTK